MKDKNWKYTGPVVATDIVIWHTDISGKTGVVLIERKNEPRGLALPGGIQEYGLTLEENSRKEAREETGLEVALEEPNFPYMVLSEPDRDPRQHTISLVYRGTGKGILKAGDDAKKAYLYSAQELEIVLQENKLVFDHSKIVRKILDDYYRNPY